MRIAGQLLFGALALAAFTPLPAQPAALAPADFAGTWDLIWQTRHGPDRKGYLVIAQQGSKVTAEIHGQGAVKAKGEIAGSAFVLHGSRLAVPYTISGRLAGGRIEGSLKILSLTKYFTGTRRPLS